MTQEDKKLLIKDLCARLPYGVYIEHTESGVIGKLCDIEVFQTYNEDDTVKDYLCHTNFFGDETCKIEYFKPYLFPLSSMTEEQKKEFNARTFEIMFGETVCKKNDEMGYGKLMEFDLDFYNKHHLDWRGLIEKDLALDATGLNIY